MADLVGTDIVGGVLYIGRLWLRGWEIANLLPSGIYNYNFFLLLCCNSLIYNVLCYVHMYFMLVSD